jgi:hypothetical protein
LAFPGACEGPADDREAVGVPGNVSNPLAVLVDSETCDSKQFGQAPLISTRGERVEHASGGTHPGGALLRQKAHAAPFPSASDQSLHASSRDSTDPPALRPAASAPARQRPLYVAHKHQRRKRHRDAAAGP